MTTFEVRIVQAWRVFVLFGSQESTIPWLGNHYLNGLFACTAGVIEPKTWGIILWTVLPQAGGHFTPGLGQDGFLGYSYCFSNATQLVCLFAENNLPTGNAHICLQYDLIKDMLT